ncbi:MAG: DNA-directed RNA polymerase subunit alpha C-terminal domain-containing protein [Phycisphaerales bacterium]|jgi:DNA-directed RNA polymerase subunit alpha|nr:tetratricopeptide repeat protein [Phycisphaeraceae bacterium]
MSNTVHPLDVVVGASEVQRDSVQAARMAAEGERFEAQGNRLSAIESYRKAVASDPADGKLLFRLGFLLDISGEEDEALRMYERAVDNPPAPINALLNLAVAYEDRGDFVRSERCLRQILETDPNHPRARLYMKDVIASKTMVSDDDHDKEKQKRSALLDTPVTDFELSVRARTCLKKMNIRTLGDLVRTTEAELLSYKNFGESSLVEIKTMLAAKGLRLGQSRDDAHRAARRAMIDSLKGSNTEAVLNKGVSELNLSVRARKALQLLNIQSLGDLVAHTEAELLGVKNFGATSLSEVRQKLAEYGLGLRKIDG